MRSHVTAGRRAPAALGLVAAIAALAAASVLARPAHAQVVVRPNALPATTFVGGGLSIAQPVGEFKNYVNAAVGLNFNLVQQLDPHGVLAVRVDGGYLVYGDETKSAALSPTLGRIRVDVNTTNNIAALSVGPQLMVPNGTFRPYVTGAIGVSYFFTESSIKGSDSPDFASTTNYHDATFAWSAAAGLYIPVRRGARPISIDLGARYHGNGQARYLREGSITEDGQGNIYFDPIHSNTNMITYQIGVTFGAR